MDFGALFRTRIISATPVRSCYARICLKNELHWEFGDEMHVEINDFVNFIKEISMLCTNTFITLTSPECYVNVMNEFVHNIDILDLKEKSTFIFFLDQGCQCYERIRS